MKVRMVLAALLASAAPAAAQPCTPQWSSLGGVNGVDGQVAASTLWDPDGSGPRPTLLVVVGFHDVAGDVFSPGVTAWDGTQWIALNSQEPNGSVQAVTVFDGQLVVGGSFTTIDGVPAVGVARLTPTGWQPLGDGLNGEVFSFGVHNGQLVASGEFTASGAADLERIARWTGGQWQPMGAPIGTDQPAMSFANLGADLIAVGGFTTIGGVPANRVARWNGSQWSAMSEGFNEAARSSAVLNGVLHVSGSFSGSGSTELDAIARWDGAAWQPVLSGPASFPSFNKIAAINGSIYATGLIPIGNGPGFAPVARLTAEGWVSLTENLSDPFSVVAPYEIGLYDGQIYVSGLFRTVPGESATQIARWTGSAWRGFGSGNSARVFGAATYQNKAIVYGDFTQIGGQPIRNVAAFDGSAWSPLGVGGPDDSGSVMATCLWNGNLVFVGNFSLGDRTQPVPIGSVAIWNGTTWSGLSQPIYGAVQACAVLNNTLYVGGQLFDAQGESLGSVARWTGTAWEPLGGGTDALVYAMAAYNGRIYIGGDFTQAGGVTATGIAAWNGTAWEPVSGPDGQGVNGTVGALFVYRNELIVGARLFTMAGGLPISSIARWNGTLWRPLGPSLQFPATIAALTEYNGKLIVGGMFNQTGNGLTLNNIGQWDGDTETWSTLGSGTNQYVLGFARVGNDLIAGGLFSTMDGLPSAYVARLGCQADPACNLADLTGIGGPPSEPDGLLTGDDFNAFISAFAAGENLADLTGIGGPPSEPDGLITGDDFNAFIAAFAAGCP
jgi:hypothetical protein